jgi:hypothetical protein
VTCRAFLILGLCCCVFVSCEKSPSTKVLFKSSDQKSGRILIAATHKIRSGTEGWDFYISIESDSGGEIARSTITSLDTPDDVGNGDLKITELVLDEHAQKVKLSFQNGKILSVPVVLWTNDDL